MKVFALIFNGASLIVDTVGWGFAWIIKTLLKGITSFCGWGVEQIQALPENIQLPIVATLIIIFIGIFLASIWMFPQIVIVTLVVIPVSIFLLKLFIGWIVLFGLIYTLYLIIKGSGQRVLYIINQKKMGEN
ncbi:MULTISPECIES: hypothetical protein [Enterococcus]|uniref:hypothetical protein n=1 Tax=Enterococcus TaxID=1350 RepID=UPI001F61C2A0|nr:hypothetical protein [Enterococcus avium]